LRNNPATFCPIRVEATEHFEERRSTTTRINNNNKMCSDMGPTDELLIQK